MLSESQMLPGLDFELSGTDPYDAMRSPLVPRYLSARRVPRQVLIQLRKRLPFDLASVLRISPYVMAKTVGCALSSSARAAVALSVTESPEVNERIRDLVRSLDQCGGSLGGGAYGYEFDVQTRWAFYPAGSPNVIATVFVARGLLEAGLAFGNANWTERAIEACRWIDDNLMVTTGRGSYYTYVPGQETLVHNANLLASMMSAFAGRVLGDGRLIDRAIAAASSSIDAQRPDGSWPYGDKQGLGWADNFHTAYNLDALCHIWLSIGDASARRAVERGVGSWRSNFFGPDGEAYYFHDKHWPIDIHSAATAVDVDAKLAMAGFGSSGIAHRVEGWVERNLAHGSETAFRRYRAFTDMRRFPRWGDAHWAMGRASLLLLDSGRLGPIENYMGGDTR